MIDIHTHILPGVDDGARTLADSVEIVKELASHGVTDIVATPHYVDETIYISSRENNKRLLDELRRELAKHKIEVSLHLGNEIYINKRILDLIKNGEISALAGSEYLLVELPMDNEYPNYEDYLQDLIDFGYKIVLAHPERYLIAQDDYGILRDLYNMGVLLQCNLGSIAGKYGRGAQKLTKKLAKDKMIFTFGSDIHHPGKNDALNLAKKKLSKYYNEDELRKLLVENPRKIVVQ